jgi:hypothetical protein
MMVVLEFDDLVVMEQQELVMDGLLLLLLFQMVLNVQFFDDN